MAVSPDSPPVGLPEGALLDVADGEGARGARGGGGAAGALAVTSGVIF